MSDPVPWPDFSFPQTPQQLISLINTASTEEEEEEIGEMSWSTGREIHRLFWHSTRHHRLRGSGFIMYILLCGWLFIRNSLSYIFHVLHALFPLLNLYHSYFMYRLFCIIVPTKAKLIYIMSIYGTFISLLLKICQSTSIREMWCSSEIVFYCFYPDKSTAIGNYWILYWYEHFKKWLCWILAQYSDSFIWQKTHVR